MKKFLGILAIAGVLVACDNSADSTKSGDSTNTDSPTVVTPAPTETAPVTSDSATMTTPTTGDSASTTTTTPTTDSAR